MVFASAPPSYCLTVDRWSTFAWASNSASSRRALGAERWKNLAQACSLAAKHHTRVPHRAQEGRRPVLPARRGRGRVRHRRHRRRQEGGQRSAADDVSFRADVAPLGQPDRPARRPRSCRRERPATGSRRYCGCPSPSSGSCRLTKCQEPTFSGPRSNRRSRPFPDLRPDGETPANELSSMARQEGRIL